MRKLILIAFLVLLCQTVHAGCCVIKASECSYWDLGSWSGQQAFCNFFSLYQMATEWSNSSCTTMQKPDACVDGWTTPPSPKIQEIMQQAVGGGGGGGCTPKWNCSDWGACQNGVQTRTCVDKKHCGFAAPKTEQKCQNEPTSGVAETVPGASPNENTVTNPAGNSGTQPPITGSTVQEVKEPSGNPLILVAVIAGILVSSVAVLLGWFAARH